jgi:hypothetical protein
MIFNESWQHHPFAHLNQYLSSPHKHNTRKLYFRPLLLFSTTCFGRSFDQSSGRRKEVHLGEVANFIEYFMFLFFLFCE